MTIFKNKITGREISQYDWNNLPYYEKANYVAYNRTSSGDFLISAAIGAATDSAILGGLFGGDIIGGILGDSLDGDLFD